MLTDDEIKHLAVEHQPLLGLDHLMAFARAICEACDRRCDEKRDNDAIDAGSIGDC